MKFDVAKVRRLHELVGEARQICDELRRASPVHSPELFTAETLVKRLTELEDRINYLQSKAA